VEAVEAAAPVVVVVVGVVVGVCSLTVINGSENTCT